MKALLRAAALAATLLLGAFAAAGSAHAADLTPFGAEVQAMSDVELSEERGGLKTPFGEIDFGAVVRTFIDGKIAVETQLDWTDAGAVQNQAIGILQSELRERAAGLGGVRLAGDLPAVVLGGHNGDTAVLHHLTGDQITNMVVNTADNRDIRLETVITIVIPELAQLQQDMIGQQLQMGLGDAIGQALVSAGL